MKQGLDVSHLGDEAYQNKLKGQRIEMPGGKGIGSDAGIRNRIDINTIKQYFNTIQNSKALKEIAELLGRLEKEEEESEIQKIKELKKLFLYANNPHKTLQRRDMRGNFRQRFRETFTTRISNTRRWDFRTIVYFKIFHNCLFLL